MQKLDVDKAYDALNQMTALYKKAFPPGTVSADGNYVMREDGRWWGRCTIIPEVNNAKI